MGSSNLVASMSAVIDPELEMQGGSHRSDGSGQHSAGGWQEAALQRLRTGCKLGALCPPPKTAAPLLKAHLIPEELPLLQTSQLPTGPRGTCCSVSRDVPLLFKCLLYRCCLQITIGMQKEATLLLYQDAQGVYIISSVLFIMVKRL